MSNKSKKSKRFPGFKPRVVGEQNPDAPKSKMSAILEGIRQLLMNGIFPANLAGMIVEAEHVLASLAKIEKDREDAAAPAEEPTPEVAPEVTPEVEETDGQETSV